MAAKTRRGAGRAVGVDSDSQRAVRAFAAGVAWSDPGLSTVRGSGVALFALCGEPVIARVAAVPGGPAAAMSGQTRAADRR